jgi:hypothetical protein
MVDFPEPETPMTMIAAGSGVAASFVVLGCIDINSSDCAWSRNAEKSVVLSGARAWPNTLPPAAFDKG